MPSIHATPIIGGSESVRQLRALIQTLAGSASTVLITGESGTGKELVAQALHNQGARAQGHFVPINCGAIPRELLESELFGHRKGAFTGAVSDRTGRFELAHGGTLFLDEIGELPLDMQVKLLRVLQDRTIQPVGATRAVPVDVRVVAATHRDLEAEVAAGRFREDLYYRLNVLPLQTTALRERPEDLPELLAFYSQRHAAPGQRPIAFGPDMLALLQQYAWPGNVRELSNLVDRFSTLYPGQTLHPHTLPANMVPAGLAALMNRHRSRAGGAQAPALRLQRTTGPEDGLEAMALLPELTAAVQGDGAAVPQREPAGPLADAPACEDTPPQAAMSPVEEIIQLAQGGEILPPQGLSLKQRMTDIERSFIAQALARTRGNVSQTARLLSLQRTTLIEKINKYDLRLP